MKKKKLNKFQNFYQKQGGKYILFFGFYIIFFIFFGIHLKNLNNSKVKVPVNQQIEEKMVSMRSLFDNDFSYQFEINDNGSITNYKGTKKNIDYENSSFKYFLDYININQLLKKSKVTETGQLITNYELDNTVLNEILNTDVLDGMNKVTEILGNSQNDYTYQIILDLSSYMQKENFIITLNYQVGEK